MKKRRSYLLLILMINLIGLIGLMMICFLPSKKDKEGMKRQKTEEAIAEQYIEDLKNKKEDSLDSWEDNVWYEKDGITYTPDYAKGVIDCVLEIETIKLRRGVYIGTWEEIYHNLDMWMVTAARPDYVLGETHYAIYGHNHPVQNLSFNRLKDLSIGDTFKLISEKGIYIYEVTDIFSDWRENVTRKVVDNMELPETDCYIITCGRNEHRYKDLVVKGVLVTIEKQKMSFIEKQKSF